MVILSERNERKRLFEQELTLLKKEGYISSVIFEDMVKAHNDYYENLLKEEKEEELQRLKMVQEKEAAIRKIKAEKKKRSPEEIRERNITWSLYLGVVLLLIGGLFVATSNWESMSSWMKSGSIGLVSFLFYGIAYLARRVLQIEKTAFAFIVLASLFLPIFILSIGWFELLGSYFSFYGEGRFYLGLFASFLLVPVYIFTALKLSSRLFVWFSLIAFTVGAGYSLAALDLSKDGFYFGMTLCNLLYIFLAYKLKNHASFSLFTKELIHYVQIHLVLSTVLMLLFFDHHIFYGFNMILTAAVYLTMIFFSGRKEYHFIFTVMLVYGVYQMIEFSPVQTFGPFVYAMLGFLFLAASKWTGEQFGLVQVFRWTSAAVSFLAFVFISVQGFLVRMEEPSVVLIGAYALIAGNFIYLANLQKNLLFRYASPVFLAASLFEGMRFLNQWLDFESWILPGFFVGLLLFLLFGCWNKWPFLKTIEDSSRDAGTGMMLAMTLAGFLSTRWLDLGIMLSLASLLSYLAAGIEVRRFYKQILPWFMPISLGFAVASFGEELRSGFAFYRETFGMAGNFALSGMIVLGAWLFLKRARRLDASLQAFFSAQGFYMAAIIFALTFPIHAVWAKPLILLGGLGMHIGFYKFTKFRWISYLIGTTGLVSYFTNLHILQLKWPNMPWQESLHFTGGAALLFLAAWFLKGKDRILYQGLSWVGHMYLPPVLLLSYFLFGHESVWGYIVAIIIYGLSTFYAVTEWKIKTFLYGAFTSMFFIVLTTFTYFIEEPRSHYAFLFTSCAISIFWMLSAGKFKLRTAYYLVPFSLIGITAFVEAYPYDRILFAVTFIYALGLLVFLHRVRWALLAPIPILLTFYGMVKMFFAIDMDGVYKIVLCAAIGLVLAGAGKLLYRDIWREEKQNGLSFDPYTIMAFLFFGYTYVPGVELLWAKILPGLLISATIWLQRNRVPRSWASGTTFLAGAYLLQPYYSAVGEINIPSLFERELIVLPWVILAIFLRYIMKEKYRKITGQIQWGILVIVSLLLVQDGLASSTVYDAILLGSLSLLSLLAGMAWKVKAYFFVGAGVLLLNIILQTRPYWGNLPWWGYLLIAGSILISAASFNEWHKQKTARGEATIFSIMKGKLVNQLGKWN